MKIYTFFINRKWIFFCPQLFKEYWFEGVPDYCFSQGSHMISADPLSVFHSIIYLMLPNLCHPLPSPQFHGSFWEDKLLQGVVGVERRTRVKSEKMRGCHQHIYWYGQIRTLTRPDPGEDVEPQELSFVADGHKMVWPF